MSGSPLGRLGVPHDTARRPGATSASRVGAADTLGPGQKCDRERAARAGPRSRSGRGPLPPRSARARHSGGPSRTPSRCGRVRRAGPSPVHGLRRRRGRSPGRRGPRARGWHEPGSRGSRRPRAPRSAARSARMMSRRRRPPSKRTWRSVCSRTHERRRSAALDGPLLGREHDRAQGAPAAPAPACPELHPVRDRCDRRPRRPRGARRPVPGRPPRLAKARSGLVPRHHALPGAVHGGPRSDNRLCLEPHAGDRAPLRAGALASLREEGPGATVGGGPCRLPRSSPVLPPGGEERPDRRVRLRRSPERHQRGGLRGLRPAERRALRSLSRPHGHGAVDDDWSAAARAVVLGGAWRPGLGRHPLGRVGRDAVLGDPAGVCRLLDLELGGGEEGARPRLALHLRGHRRHWRVRVAVPGRALRLAAAPGRRRDPRRGAAGAIAEGARFDPVMKAAQPATLLLVLASAALASCNGGDSSSDTTAADSCSTLGQVQFVRDTMQDIYFWYQHLPNPDPSGFASPEAYLEAVRYRPIDTSYSFIADKAESDAFFSDSEFIGLGISTRQTSATELRVSQVFAASPASEAGLARGDFLLSINGRSVPELLQTGDINSIFGPAEVGVVVSLTWRRLEDHSMRSASLTKRSVTIPTVSLTSVYDVRRGPRVGYVFFRNFVQPSTAALNTAFHTLREAGAKELVLDLRYNGGGLLGVAQHLGGLIGGAATNGQVFVELFHNDKNPSRNTTYRFELPAEAIGFTRFVAITTRGTASASESVINGLKPFMPVTLVGDTTYGKPVGQYGFDFCTKTLFPVAFEARNARGEGEYFDGLPADCAAADDLDHELGDPDEDSLGEALEFMRSGRCTPAAADAARVHAAREARIGKGQPSDPWRQLLGAY